MSIPTTGVYMLRYRVVPSDVSVDYRFATDLKGDAQPIELALRTSEVQDKQYWIVKILSAEEGTCEIYSGAIKPKDGIPGWRYSSKEPHTPITLDAPSSFILESAGTDNPNICFIRIPNDRDSTGTALLVGTKVEDDQTLVIRPFAIGDFPLERPAWEFELISSPN